MHDSGLSDLTGPLIPIFHHRWSYVQPNNKVQAQSDSIIYAHTQQSLNVAIHMPYVNMRCAGCYQLELFFALFRLPLIVMGNALIGNGYACDACDG